MGGAGGHRQCYRFTVSNYIHEMFCTHFSRQLIYILPNCSVCVCVCVSVHLWCRYTCLCVHIWSPKVDVGCSTWSQYVFSRNQSLSFKKQSTLVDQQDSWIYLFTVALCNTKVRVWGTRQGFMWVLGIQTHVLMFGQQAFTHWTVSPPPTLSSWIDSLQLKHITCW